MNGEKRRIEVSMVEFDWIFAGKEGLMFLEELADLKDDELLKVDAIKVCIHFLWGFYFWKIFFFVFVPYTIFFIVFLLYSSILYDGSNQGFELNYIFGTYSILYCLVIMCMEVKQMINQGKEYWTSSSLIWNIVDFVSCSFVLIFTISDFVDSVSP
jgi:hypothetical protein